MTWKTGQWDILEIVHKVAFLCEKWEGYYERSQDEITVIEVRHEKDMGWMIS